MGRSGSRLGGTRFRLGRRDRGGADGPGASAQGTNSRAQEHRVCRRAAADAYRQDRQESATRTLLARPTAQYLIERDTMVVDGVCDARFTKLRDAFQTNFDGDPADMHTEL